jgi:hypothetical protein
MPNPRLANQYHGNPQMGPDGILYYPDGSIARPDGSIVNPPTGPQHSALGGGTAGMSAVDQYNTMVGNRDSRRTGGQVNPYTPAVGPYGSSNPGRDQKEREIANRYGPQTGIPHPLSVRSDVVESSAGHGGQVLEDKYTKYQTGKVTDASSPHFGAEYNNTTHYYDHASKLVVPNDPAPVETGPKTKDPSPFMPSQGTPQENAIRNSVIQPNTAGRGFPATGSTIPPTVQQPVLPSSYGSGGDNALQANQGVGVSASLNKPISEFGIEDGTEHLQKLYDKQRELMEQGQNSQNSAAARAIRRRAMELDDHISKLNKSAALKTPEQLEADGERPLPPIKPPQYVGPLETDWEQGMHSFDKDGSGGLNQEELRAWRRWKQVGQGKRPDHRGNIVGEGHPNFTKHGSSTQMTPPGMMPGYTIGGGVDTTGTQYQDTGGVNPDAPLFGAGMGFGTPPLGTPDDPSVSGQDMMQQFPPGMPNQSPAERAGMTDSVPAQPDVNKQAQMLASSIANGEAIYRSILQNPQIPDAVKAKLAQLDANGNGYLSKNELRNADSILGDIGAVIDRSNLPKTGVLARIAANREKRRNNRGR